MPPDHLRERDNKTLADSPQTPLTRRHTPDPRPVTPGEEQLLDVFRNHNFTLGLNKVRRLGQRAY